MKKDLKDMTLEELWQLFPIFLVDHNDSWKNWYIEESSYLKSILNNINYKINHIGSTYIPYIQAKNIVDILIEVDLIDLLKTKNILLENNYILMSENSNKISFNKGYTNNGFADKVFHIHLRVYGDNDELYFRDYLIDKYDIAKEYEKLKLDLWKKYEFNRDLYTNSKTEFIKKYTELAKNLYKNKY